MDMYRILENFDAVNSKQTLTEGSMKDMLHKRADSMSKEDFVADAGEYGMKPEEAVEFWIAVNGDDDEELDEDLQADSGEYYEDSADFFGMFEQDHFDEEKESEDGMEVHGYIDGKLVMAWRFNGPDKTDGYGAYDDSELIDEERRSPEEFDADAIAKQKARLAREKQKIMMQRKISGQDSGKPPVVQDMSEAGMEESALQAYLGKKKYGPEGMKALQQAGREGASKEKMAKIRASHDKMDEGDEELNETSLWPARKGERVSAEGKPAVIVGQLMTPAGSASYYAVRFDGRQYSGDNYDIVHANQVSAAGVSAPKGPLSAYEKSRMEEGDMEEGNKFAHNVLKAKAAGMKKADLDGDGDMETVREVFPGTPEYELRFGKDDASSAFDKKKISTGTVYSRRYKDEPESDDDAPKSAGRPKGTGRKLGAKGPSVASKLLKDKGGLKEQDIDIQDRGEYDREGDMALNQVHQIADAARELHAILASDDNLPEWVQSKITKALDYIDTARDYLGAEGEMDREQAVAEKAPPGAKAERMVKHIKSGYAKDGGLTDQEKAIAYATAWKAKKAGKVDEYDTSNRNTKTKKEPTLNLPTMAKQVDTKSYSREDDRPMSSTASITRKRSYMEEPTDKKDVPFDGPYRKKDDDKDQYGNKIKHAARHAARQGLADMTTADLKAELKRRSQVEEESTDTKDQHAERAGKKVTKDLEYDMKHKGKDDAKAEKAGKKVTKDIEYDDKKDKKKEVEETTVSGSVAPAAGGAAPKSKGGMQFGKGVYEGQVAESFEKQLKNVLNEGMSVNVSTDDTGKKSISVNATDSDADALGDMLKMAGLFSSEGYSRTCESCHGIHEAGACSADQVEEDLANSPDEVYADADYMTQTLSGGLNGPKTTGQTTGAVVNRQDSRQGVMAEAERVKEQAESRLWNLYKKI